LKRRASFLAAAAALLAGCASIPLPERDGVAIYRKKCGACHHPYAPVELKPEKWEKTLGEMARRAKLTQDEAARIRAYVEPDLVRPANSH